MALSANTVTETRATGSDTNGGGFVTGASGTDWSQQDAPQYAVTDAVTNGTTTITSATAGFGTDVVGNLIYMAGGTGSIAAARYQVISRTNSTTIVVDRSTGLTTGTGATLNLGGALATPAVAISLMTVVGINGWLRYNVTPYSLGTGITFPSNGGSGFTAINKLEGYTVTRGDRSTKPIIRSTAAINAFTMNVSGNSNWLINLDIDGNNTGNNGVVASNTTYGGVSECLIRRQLNVAFSSNNTAMTFSRNEVTGCGGATDACAVHAVTTNVIITKNNIHHNTTAGIKHGSNSQGGVVTDNIIAFNSGGSSDGMISEAYFMTITGNIFYQSGRDGLRLQRNYVSIQGEVTNNIIVSNAGYGIEMMSAPTSQLAIPVANYNFFYLNALGPRNNYPPGTNDVTLTGDPFVDPTNGDFRLNNTAGAGAAVRAAGFPGTMPGGLTVGYRDGGPIQHQDSGGAAGIVVNSGMTGGLNG
jgi:hypothetical protein